MNYVKGGSVLALALLCIFPAIPSLSLDHAGVEPVVSKEYAVGNAFGRAWGGVYATYDAIERDGVVYVGFYDEERWLSIAQVDTQAGSVKVVRTSVRFSGWDSHNSVSLGLDESGRLHVVGNVHAQPLRYLVEKIPKDLSSLELADRMDGLYEKSVTYPRFLNRKDGHLVFVYRDGGSGDGVTRVKFLRNGEWISASSPLLAKGGFSSPVNAYPNIAVDGEGCFHMAWTWRLSRDANTNFDVGYAKTCDFEHWVDVRGENVIPPITPLMQGLIVEHIKPGGGLFNDIKIGFLKAGGSVLSYVRRDDKGVTQLVHSAYRGGRWLTVSADVGWTYSWDFSGEGTKLQAITYSGISEDAGGRANELVMHPESGLSRLFFDPATLKVVGQEPVKRDASICTAIRDSSAEKLGARHFTRKIRRADGKGGRYFLSWSAFPSDNGDKKPSCSGGVGRVRCDYASDIGICLN